MEKSVYWTCVNHAYFQKVLLLGDIFKVPIKHITTKSQSDKTTIALFLDKARKRGFLTYQETEQGPMISFELWSKIGKVVGNFENEKRLAIHYRLLPKEKEYNLLEGTYRAGIYQSKNQIYQSMSCFCKNKNQILYTMSVDGLRGGFQLNRNYLHSPEPKESIIINKNNRNELFFLHTYCQEPQSASVLQTKVTYQTKENEMPGTLYFDFPKKVICQKVSLAPNSPLFLDVLTQVERYDASLMKLMHDFHSYFQFGQFDLYQNVMTACLEDFFHPEELEVITGGQTKSYQKNRRLVDTLNAFRK